MNVNKTIFGILSLVVIVLSLSAAQMSTRADRAIDAVKDLCLVGTQYDLKADGKGNLTFLRLAPGGTGEFSVNVRSSQGAAAIFDEKLRIQADEKTRDCIKPSINKIIDAILQDDFAEPPSSISIDRKSLSVIRPSNEVPIFTGTINPAKLCPKVRVGIQTSWGHACLTRTPICSGGNSTWKINCSLEIGSLQSGEYPIKAMAEGFSIDDVLHVTGDQVN